jgi:malonyl-CoA decarboxylase
MSTSKTNSGVPPAGAVDPMPTDQAGTARAGILARLGRLWGTGRLPPAREVKALFTARLTDVAANRLAQKWCELYSASDGAQSRAMLATLAEAFALFPVEGDEGVRFFKRLNALSGGIRFLVGLRADMLRWRKQVSALSVLERHLEGLLSAWFDVGMLELRRLTWDSPASLLEKLIQYEAVHAIKSWDDLRHRVGNGRRCYAFFHPQMPDVPLIFVEVALGANMAENVQALLDTQSPNEDPDDARWAIFYSISNTQAGLRGISFGNFLLKRVIDQLLTELPKLKGFATLSPIPGFNDWLARQGAVTVEKIVRNRSTERSRAVAPDGARWMERFKKAALGRSSETIRRAALALVAHYVQLMKNGQPVDAVARFHLGNGARIERLNWGADRSTQGVAQSSAIMVNYRYVLDDLDANLAKLGEGRPSVSRTIARVE